MHWKVTLQMCRVNQTKCFSNFNVQTEHLRIMIKHQFYRDPVGVHESAFLTNPPDEADAAGP